MGDFCHILYRDPNSQQHLVLSQGVGSSSFFFPSFFFFLLSASGMGSMLAQAASIDRDNRASTQAGPLDIPIRPPCMASALHSLISKPEQGAVRDSFNQDDPYLDQVYSTWPVLARVVRVKSARSLWHLGASQRVQDLASVGFFHILGVCRGRQRLLVLCRDTSRDCVWGVALQTHTGLTASTTSPSGSRPSPQVII